MRFSSHKQSIRGNVMIATIGTLTVLMIVVMAAANSTQMTWNTASIAMQDSRLRAALSEAAVLIQAKPDLLASALASAAAAPAETTATLDASGETTSAVVASGDTTSTRTPGAMVPIISAASDSKQIVINGAMGEMESIPVEIPQKPGDTAVILHAQAASGQGNGRHATYLINTQGQRPAPVLVSERRVTAERRM